MATIDLSNLTINPKECDDFGKFVMERTFARPELKAVHNVMTGVKMKEQIVLASLMGLSGKLANGCNAVSSGAGSVLTQKYWEPASIEDTIETCLKSQNQLFKAYAEKLKAYKETYDMTGSDEEQFILALVEDAINATISRAIWFGDKSVAAATSSAAGLISSSNVYAFNYFDGLWKQIFAGVTAGTVKRTTISATITKANVMTTLEAVYASADPRLRNDLNANILVSGDIFVAYCQKLADEGNNSTIDYTLNGIPTVKYMGHNIINMETIWDVNNQYFESNTSGAAGDYLPSRVAFVAPANIPVATLAEEDFGDIESWYEKADKKNYTRYGFTLDAKLLDEDLIVVAY